MDRGMFLNPQYLVGEPSVWTANPDFLALEFPERRAWMVEVSKYPQASLFNKIKMFKEEYVHRIRAQLENHKVLQRESSADDWSIGLWIFVPQTALAGLERRMQAADVEPRKVTALEDTLAPSAWGSRFR
jgi:hypothetical protein